VKLNTLSSIKFPLFRRALVVLGCTLLVTLALVIHPITAAAAPSISLAWDPNLESNLDGYKIYRSTQSGVFNSSPLNGTSLLKTESFIDVAVQAGQTYYYVVTAVSVDGTESTPSNQVQAVISAGSADTTAPTVTLTVIPLP
jgi:fibronectin type 3 domain-containing protein